MMLPTLATVEAFVAWEETQEEKYEFADGEILLLPGGTHRHATIAANLTYELRARGLPPGTVYYEPKTVTKRSSRYPDVAVALDPRERPEHTVTRYPILLIEVLSASTERVDRGEKVDEYRSLDTLQEYVLVDSRKRWAQIFRRARDQWIVTLPTLGGVLDLWSVGVSIPFDALYAGTEL